MAQPITAISGVNVEVSANGAELVKFSGQGQAAPRKAFTLPNPPRVVIDIDRVPSATLSLPKNYRGTLIKSVRFGQFDATTSRIVLDLAGPITLTQSESPDAALAVLLTPGGTSAITPAIEVKPLIVIDAGHGGQDPGAIGLHDTHEKDITLGYARHLRKALLATGRYRVALTRDDDRFILLPERVAIARKLKADIFISLHADSNPRPEARGFSIYTLSETASDDESAALAEQENKADIIPGIDLNKTDADVASILIDLTQRETMNKSAIFADAVVASLHGKITRLQKTHRYAGFRVLKAPDMPSVLIELGFLSNADDERLLLSPEYRDLVTSSIVKGIDRFRAGE
ncbi:MAG: N-acetylmuramoyl-L-alanine amidase [Rickettsiales bacterium]|nr:N-acetylmuramoyl-L-alanine amidase [Rickettsiales bacterium]